MAESELNLVDFQRAKYVEHTNSKWNNLMADGEIRNLMRIVPQVTSKEIVIYEKVREILKQWISELPDTTYNYIMGDVRRKIITFFNDIYFGNMCLLPDKWWWEMSFRFEKLLSASMVLEAINLVSFDEESKLDIMDIPQSLTQIRAFISMKEEEFAHITMAYTGITEKHVPKKFTNIYLNEKLKDDGESGSKK